MHEPNRKRLPDSRHGITQKRDVCGFELYVTVNFYEDPEEDRDKPGEVFCVVGKQGSTVGSLMDAVALFISMSLQYGVPWGKIHKKLRHYRFDDKGDEQHSSLLDGLAQVVDELIKERQSVIGHSQPQQPQQAEHVAHLTPGVSVSRTSDGYYVVIRAKDRMFMSPDGSNWWTTDQFNRSKFMGWQTFDGAVRDWLTSEVKDQYEKAQEESQSTEVEDQENPGQSSDAP